MSVSRVRSFRAANADVEDESAAFSPLITKRKKTIKLWWPVQGYGIIKHLINRNCLNSCISSKRASKGSIGPYSGTLSFVYTWKGDGLKNRIYEPFIWSSHLDIVFWRFGVDWYNSKYVVELRLDHFGEEGRWPSILKHNIADIVTKMPFPLELQKDDDEQLKCAN